MSKKSFETLTETMFYVLMALQRQERCGTEIMEFVREKTAGRVRLGPGTLYTILGRFEEENILRETKGLGRKRPYRLTEKGKQLYEEEVKRLQVRLADAEREAAYVDVCE